VILASALELTLYRVQMRMAKPFTHARAARDESDDVFVVIDLDGVRGVGEGVPRDYVTGETVESALEAISKLDLAAIVGELSSCSFDVAVTAIEALALPQRLAASQRPALAAACAVELALLDLVGQRTSTSLAALGHALDLPPAMRRAPNSSRAIPKSRALDLRGEAADLQRGPFVPDHIKLKGSSDAELDLARVRSVRELFGSSVTLSVDANMAWTLDEATARWEMLRPYEIAWFEEPLAQYALDDYRSLRERCGARVMLDESLGSFDDGRRAVDANACDLFNIRISKHGGLVGALRLAELAHRFGIGLHLGWHPGQSGVLGAAGAHFMSTVVELVACEGAGAWIGTGGLPESIIREQLFFDAATARCQGLRDAGLGVTLDLEVVDRHATRKHRWDETRSGFV